MCERITSSPGFRLAPPQLAATRLMASVAPLVKTISLTDGAFRNAATLPRLPSKASVEVCDVQWTPLCTLE